MITPVSGDLLTTPVGGGSPAARGSNTAPPDKLQKAASDFEALLLGQVMKSERQADGSGWLGTDDSDAGSSLSDMSEQQLAQSLASSGGLGLAKMISTGLAKTSGNDGGTQPAVTQTKS